MAQQFVGQKEAAFFHGSSESAVAVLETLFKGSGFQGWLALLPLYILSSPRASLETLQHSAAPAPFPTCP